LWEFILAMWSLAALLLLRLRLRGPAAGTHRRQITSELEYLEAAPLTPAGAEGTSLPATHLSLPRDAAKGGARVRLVVISDTHSFEEQLTGAKPRPHGGKGWHGDGPGGGVGGSGATLPDGDVLVHCGDWATCPRFDGRSVSAHHRCFDGWLAAQPHKHKVVIAGNHDPADANFPRSNAIYVGAGSRSVEVGGVTFALVPYFREESRTTTSRSASTRTEVHKVKHRHFSLPKGEVLVSHSPPHRVLDRCGSGAHAGSSYLRKLVERAEVKPALWLCGHIHEDRGIARVCFGDEQQPTVVVNAANANPGIARRLVQGALVIDLE